MFHLSSKQHFTDPYTKKRKSLRYKQHAVEQSKLKHIADIYDGHWLCNVWMKESQNGKGYYCHWYTQKRDKFVKQYCNKMVRRQPIDLENGVDYKIKGNCYKKISCHFRNWWG